MTLAEALRASEEMYVYDDDTVDNVFVYDKHISWVVHVWYEEEDEGPDWGHISFWKVCLSPKLTSFEQKEYRYKDVRDFLGDSGNQGFHILDLLEGPWHLR